MTVERYPAGSLRAHLSHAMDNLTDAADAAPADSDVQHAIDQATSQTATAILVANGNPVRVAEAAMLDPRSLTPSQRAHLFTQTAFLLRCSGEALEPDDRIWTSVKALALWLEARAELLAPRPAPAVRGRRIRAWHRPRPTR